MLNATLNSKRIRKVLFWGALILLCGWFLLGGSTDDRLPDEAELTVVHLTDLHLATQGTVTNTPWTHKIVVRGYRLHRPCTGKAFDYLEKAVSLIQTSIKPDLVVVTGDVVDRGDDIEALRRGASILRQLSCPILVVQGDHDIPRKEANRACWKEVFGATDGCRVVNDTSFFFLPFEKDAAASARILQSIRDVPDSDGVRFLCLHRMLRAPRLMDWLAQRFHGCSVLDPDHAAIIQALDESEAQWVVLCGHSHTESRRTWGRVSQICTSSLAEYPHAFRVVKINKGQVFSALVRLDGRLKNDT